MICNGSLYTEKVPTFDNSWISQEELQRINPNLFNHHYADNTPHST